MLSVVAPRVLIVTLANVGTASQALIEQNRIVPAQFIESDNYWIKHICSLVLVMAKLLTIIVVILKVRGTVATKESLERL